MRFVVAEEGDERRLRENVRHAGAVAGGNRADFGAVADAVVERQLLQFGFLRSFTENAEAGIGLALQNQREGFDEALMPFVAFEPPDGEDGRVGAVHFDGRDFGQVRAVGDDGELVGGQVQALLKQLRLEIGDGDQLCRTCQQGTQKPGLQVARGIAVAGRMPTAMEREHVGDARAFGCQHCQRRNERVNALAVDDVPAASGNCVTSDFAVQLRREVVVAVGGVGAHAQDVDAFDDIFRHKLAGWVGGEHGDADATRRHAPRDFVDVGFDAAHEREVARRDHQDAHRGCHDCTSRIG